MKYTKYNIKDILLNRIFDIPIYGLACFGISEYVGNWVALIFFIVFFTISFARGENQLNEENIEVLHDEIEKMREELRIYREQVLE
jgi:hypothetical protein